MRRGASLAAMQDALWQLRRPPRGSTCAPVGKAYASERAFSQPACRPSISR